MPDAESRGREPFADDDAKSTQSISDFGYAARYGSVIAVLCVLWIGVIIMSSVTYKRPLYVKPVVEVCDDPAQRVAELVSEAAASAIKDHGSFAIAIAGGSLAKMLAQLDVIESDKWLVAWVDERVVPHDSDESNYGVANKDWLSKMKKQIPDGQIIRIDEKLCTNEKGAEPAAMEYEKQLKAIKKGILPRREDGLPAFDLLLLGFGADGHIASLFPGHKALDDTSKKWILPISDSPKDPKQRITLSLPAVNSASQVILVGTGKGKAKMLQKAFKPGSKLPCRLALGATPETVPPTFIVDKKAAAKLGKVDGDGRVTTIEMERID